MPSQKRLILFYSLNISPFEPTPESLVIDFFFPFLFRINNNNKGAHSCLTLCDPMDCSLPGSSHGIFQARVLEWAAISFSRGSSPLRDWTQVSHIVGRHFTIWATREVFTGLGRAQSLKHNVLSHFPWGKGNGGLNEERRVPALSPPLGGLLLYLLLLFSLQMSLTTKTKCQRAAKWIFLFLYTLTFQINELLYQ